VFKVTGQMGNQPRTVNSVWVDYNPLLTLLQQDPGKVFKNKKMAGQMGNQTRTVQSVWVYKVDPSRDLIYVRGQVGLPNDTP
jgi:ribosomal protein L3